MDAPHITVNDLPFEQADFEAFRDRLIERTRDFYQFIDTRIGQLFAEHRENNGRLYELSGRIAKDIAANLDETPLPPIPEPSADAHTLDAYKQAYEEAGILQRLQHAQSPKHAMDAFQGSAYTLGHYRAVLAVLAFWKGDEKAEAVLRDFTPIFETLHTDKYTDGMRGPCFLHDLQSIMGGIVSTHPNAMLQQQPLPQRLLYGFKNDQKEEPACFNFAVETGRAIEKRIAMLYGTGVIPVRQTEFSNHGSCRTQGEFGFVATDDQMAQVLAELGKPENQPVPVDSLWASKSFSWTDFVFAVNNVATIRLAEFGGYNPSLEYPVTLHSFRSPTWEGIYTFPGVAETRTLAAMWREEKKPHYINPPADPIAAFNTEKKKPVPYWQRRPARKEPR